MQKVNHIFKEGFFLSREQYKKKFRELEQKFSEQCPDSPMHACNLVKGLLWELDRDMNHYEGKILAQAKILDQADRIFKAKNIFRDLYMSQEMISYRGDDL